MLDMIFAVTVVVLTVVAAESVRHLCRRILTRPVSPPVAACTSDVPDQPEIVAQLGPVAQGAAA